MGQIAQEFDIQILYKALYGYSAPPFPSLGNLKEQITPTGPLGTINAIADQYKKTLIGTTMVMPLSMAIPGEEFWTVPIEPMVSLKGANKIIQRYPNRSERGGSIKERWSADDYRISIKGVLINLSDTSYPEYDVNKLREICENGIAKVENTMFRIFGIERLAIKDFDIPFTPGLKNQAFTIEALSDQLFDALLEEI